MKIYAASLTDYNNGNLHGAWIDATLSKDEIMEEIQEMLAESEYPDAEEWAIHDYDDLPNMGEYPDLGKVSEIANAIEDHGDAYRAYIDLVGIDDADERDFQDRYLGKYDSAEDYAYSYVEDTGLLKDVPEELRNYFDYEAFGRDMVLEGDIAESNGHWFRRC